MMNSQNVEKNTRTFSQKGIGVTRLWNAVLPDGLKKRTTSTNLNVGRRNDRNHQAACDPYRQ